LTIGKDRENLYQILGVSPRATQEEIRRRYRQLVKEMHPDRNEGEEGEAIRRVNEAHAVLSQVKRRTRYDAVFFHEMRNGVRRASSFSSSFNYERTKRAYEAYLERTKKRKRSSPR
jgi:curved DNA-binding protein CbpA